MMFDNDVNNKDHSIFLSKINNFRYIKMMAFAIIAAHCSLAAAIAPGCPKYVTESINLGTVTTNPVSECVSGACVSYTIPATGAFSNVQKIGPLSNCYIYTVTYTGNYVGSPVIAYPRYVVVGVTYAPPGPSSFVTYSQSGTVGTTVSSGSSFGSTTSVSASVSGSGGISGFASGKVTATVTAAATQSNSTSNSTTLSLQTTSTTKTGGPTNAYAPVNHDYDIIWLWLNPVAQFNVTSGSTNEVTFTGFGFDMADEPQMDIWPVYVGELNGHFSMEAGTQAEFTRSWAASGKYFPAGDAPAITSADYANILAADPFTGNYTFAVNNSVSPVTTTDGRFSLASSSQGAIQQIDYVPGLSQTYSLATSNSSTTSNSTSHSFSETFSVDTSAEGGAAVASFLSDLKVSNQLTWTHTQGNSTTKSTTYTNALSVSGPCSTAAGCNPAYTGLSVFSIYQDNIWGTFFFDGIR